MDHSLKRRQRLAIRALLLFGTICACAHEPVQAADKNGKAVSVQEVVRTERPRGPVFVGVVSVQVFGLTSDRRYCSAAIRVTNSSNAALDELIFGITYSTGDGKAAGGTSSRIADVKVHRVSRDEYYRLAVPTCQGLTGMLTVVRCTYASGDDCVNDVKPITVGPLPLQYKGS